MFYYVIIDTISMPIRVTFAWEEWFSSHSITSPIVVVSSFDLTMHVEHVMSFVHGTHNLLISVKHIYNIDTYYIQPIYELCKNVFILICTLIYI